MANFHILKTSDKADVATVVFHIPVPDESNSATPTPVNLRTALMEAEPFTTSAKPGLAVSNPTENTDLQNGVLYEIVRSVEFDANATNLAKQTIIDNIFTALSTTVPNVIRARLKFWGTDRDVS